MSSLKQKSIDGVVWTLIEKFGIQIIKVVLGVILARLLTPADYGLIGMITVFFAIAMVFIDSGFGMAYIQKQNTSETDASTIFYFNLIVSTFFYLVLWFSAPLIASFYQQPQLVDLVRVMSLVLIINSFGLIQITKLKKDINFKKKTILILISAVLATTSGIIAALNNYGVWSLVIQELVRSVVKTTGLWLFYKWRPKFTFSLPSLKSMFSFSMWALFSSMLTTVFNNLYIIVIGKFFPAAQLGFYSKANQFQKLISQTPSNAVGTVAFPVFSKQQSDSKVLKNSTKRFNVHIIFFIAPLTAIFITIAEPFFLILLTEKWLPMVPYFQLLLIAGVLYPIHMVNVQLLIAQGKMKLNFNLAMIKNALRVLNIIIMYRYGVLHIIYGEIALSIIALAINTYYSKKFVNYGLIEQIKDVFASLITSVGLLLISVKLVEFIANDYLKIVFATLFIGSLYLLSIFIINRKLFMENLEIIKNKLPEGKKKKGK